MDCKDGEKCLVSSSKDQHVDTDFTEKTWREDLTLIVEGKQVHVAKNILALVSPVFEKMFQRDFVEGKQTEIQLPDKKLHDVKEFLRCFYPNKDTTISNKNVYGILPLADEYQAVCVKSKCEAFLLLCMRKSLQLNEIYRLLNIASQHNLEELMAEGLQLASKKSLHELDEADQTVAIPVEVKNVIHRKTMENLEMSVDRLTEKLQRMETLNKFHRGGLPKTDQLDEEDYTNGTYVSSFVKLDTYALRSAFRKEYKRTENICGYIFEWTFLMNSSRNLKFQLNHQLSRSEECILNKNNNSISMIFNVVLINPLKSNNFSRIYRCNVSRPGYFSQCYQLASFSEIEQFSCDGQLELEIHLVAKKI